MDDSFRYLIGEKEKISIVLFCGPMGSKQIPEIEKLQSELKAKKPGGVIFHFRDVSILQSGIHQSLTLLQKSMRDENINFAISSLNPDIKKFLLLAGIVRSSEVFNNVPDAWKALKTGP